MSNDPISVVFVHGTGCNATIWHHQVSHLSGKYRPLAVDLPGHGEAGGQPQSDIEAYADAVERFIADHKADRPVIAGHSLGGGIILTMALRNPSAYRGLVLVGTGARLRVLPAIIQQSREDFPSALALMSDLEWAASTDPALKAEYRRQAEVAGSNVIWCDFTACDKFDAIGRLGALTMPAVAIVGEQDKLTPPKYAQYFQQNLPNCTTAVIPGAGHMVQIEQPTRFNEALGAFLATL
ncbi:MAG: alpha/beta hydrolase [Chloroflexi bacterium]|nr:alpha/beta hydrolase [Chloroflexota bacterium]